MYRVHFIRGWFFTRLGILDYPLFPRSLAVSGDHPSYGVQKVPNLAARCYPGTCPTLHVAMTEEILPLFIDNRRTFP